MAEHNDFGRMAEDAAVEYLRNNGYDILTRNYRYLKAEIDIIAKQQSTIVIVEVKARSNSYFMEPQEAVNHSKMKLLLSAANHYIENYGEDADVRFDILSMTASGDREFKIEHLVNAFDSADIN